MAKSRSVNPTVKVTYIRTPDSELRIAQAIDILLATAYPDEDCIVRTDENENRENDSPGSDHKGDFAGEDR